MLTYPNVITLVASSFALFLSWFALLASKSALRSTCGLLPVKDKLDKLDKLNKDIIRSIMDAGGDASVEAVLQTTQRIMDMDDGTMTTEDALKQAREMHKR